MSKNKPKTPGLPRIWLMRAARVLGRCFPQTWQVPLALSLVVAAGAGGYWAWPRLRPVVVSSGQYMLTVGNLHVTPPPEWIRADVKTEVVRQSGLDGQLSILDDDLLPRIAAAFEFHPWVEKVSQVRKQSGPRVDVRVVYRRPVAMVRLAGQRDLDLIPVDARGVRLPSEDFSPTEKLRYPRLSEIRDQPLVGQAWTEPRLLGALRLAALLEEVWEKLGLKEIAASESADPTLGLPVEYNLYTHNGAHIWWGHAPGNKNSAESHDAEKLSELTQIIEKWTESNDVPGSDPQVIDLRHWLPPQRTATEQGESPLR